LCEKLKNLGWNKVRFIQYLSLHDTFKVVVGNWNNDWSLLFVFLQACDV
jgi:hypothetical protein